MSANTKNRLTVSAEMHLRHSPEAIWPQLCPVREYDWIESWECEMVHSVSGYNELGCVFRTDLPTEIETETWVTSRFDPMERIEFVRTNESRVIRFVIELSHENGGTRMTWTQHIVPLNERGKEYLKDKPAAFAGQMGVLEEMLAHYLSTGEMLRGAGLGLQHEVNDHVHGGKTG